MPKLRKRRILVVDDHPAMREGLRAILRSARDLEVCGEAENSRKAMAAIKELQPDLVIVDISLREDFDGLELTRRLHEQRSAPPVLVFSLHDEQAYCDAALGAGARGYCLKGETGKVLINAVRQILHGKPFVSELVGRGQRTIIPGQAPIQRSE